MHPGAAHAPWRGTCTPALSPPLLPPRAREYVLLTTLYVWLLLPKVSRATRRLGLEQLLALLAEAGTLQCRQRPGLGLGLGWGLGFGLGLGLGLRAQSGERVWVRVRDVEKKG
jgi:hypothetical protein